MAPVFVPILTLLGYHPALVQLAYRIGDSCTNAMSPTSAYIFMILGIAQERYSKKIELGTLFAVLIPCSLVITVVWILLFAGYVALGLPIGPGTGIYL